MKQFDFDQYSPAWWTARRGIPTASEMGNIITPAKGEPSASMDAYVCQLIADLSNARYGQQEEYVSVAMQRGSELEPSARAWYELERGADVEQVGFCMTEDGRFGASPDGLIGDDGAAEFKSPEPHTHVRWLLDGVLPQVHKPQCHGHLIVTGRSWCDFMSYSPGLPSLLVRVEPDDYTKKLRDLLEVFWTKYQDALKKMRDLGWSETPMEMIEDEGPSSPEAAALALT